MLTQTEFDALIKEEKTLSTEQAFALKRVLVDGKNLFLSGEAGTGKSHIISILKRMGELYDLKLAREAAKRDIRVSLLGKKPTSDNEVKTTTFLTALTGVAALNVKGQTVHRFAGIGMGKGTDLEMLKMARTRASEKWRAVKLLVIDEISMMDPGLFETLGFIAGEIRHKKKDHLFGGIQLVVCGDFYQLPPVSASPSAKLCFESELWKRMFPMNSMDNIVILEQNFRQSQDDLRRLLKIVRSGAFMITINPLGGKRKRSLYTPEEEEAMEADVKWATAKLKALQLTPPIEGKVYTKLYSINNAVEAENHSGLNALQGPEKRFSASDVLPRHNPDFNLGAYMLVEKEITLKVGARVMLLKNMHDDLVNGSTGIVVALRGDAVVVAFQNGSVETVERVLFEVCDNEGKRIASRTQIPLKLAWAMTIHKSQGLSIDYLEVDISKCFACGQAYVALSRARTLEGLRILNFDPRKIITDQRVIEFYNQINEKTQKRKNVKLERGSK